MMNETFANNEASLLRQSRMAAGDMAEAVLGFYIDDDDDLIGLIAYALYERQKRDFVVSHRKRNGRSPSDAEIEAVTSNYLSNDLRNTLRDRASQILSSYAETYVEAMEPQIRLDAANSEVLTRAQAIEKAIGRRLGFWRQVTAGFMITVLVILLFSTLAIGAVLFGTNIVEAWHSFLVPTLRT